MKVAIYTRVSTDHQIDKDSLPMQRKDLIAYSQLIIGTDDYEIFEDAGYSGKNIARPGFQAMMERVTATMISRANNGIWNGGHIPFGYTYNSEQKEFEICPEEAENV